MDQGGGKRRSLILIQRAEELPIVSDEAGCDAITNYFILVTLPPSPVGSFVVPLGLTGERFGLVPNPLRNHAAGATFAPQRISAMALAGRRVGSGRACDTYLFDVVVDPQKHDAHKHSGSRWAGERVGSACAVGRRTSTTKLTCSPSWRSPGPKV